MAVKHVVDTTRENEKHMSYLRETINPARKLWLAAGAATVMVALPACGSDTEGPATVASTSTLSESPATTTSSESPASSPSSAPSSTAQSGPTNTATSSFLSGPEALDAAAELDIEDQSGPGTEVRVDRVRLSSGAGHVAIFTVTGQLLGSASVSDGMTAVTIPLDPPVEGSGELLGVLYGDDGGSFAVGTTPRIVDEEGDPEVEDFDYRVS